MDDPLYKKHLLGNGAPDNGEEVCEGHRYSRAECEAINCCQWDDGECWSSVGKDPCDNAGK